MGGIVRVVGWGWLLVGLLAVISVIFAHQGVHLPVPAYVAPALAYPWSSLVTAMNMTPSVGLTILGVGVIINANILFVIARILES